MNRAERRRLKREKERGDAQRMMREEDIIAMKDDAVDTAVERMWIIMMAFPLLVLRDHYGFGKKRMSDFMDYLIETYDSFQQGYFDLPDLVQTIHDEAGVDVMKLTREFSRKEVKAEND